MQNQLSMLSVFIPTSCSFVLEHSFVVVAVVAVLNLHISPFVPSDHFLAHLAASAAEERKKAELQLKNDGVGGGSNGGGGGGGVGYSPELQRLIDKAEAAAAATGPKGDLTLPLLWCSWGKGGGGGANDGGGSFGYGGSSFGGGGGGGYGYQEENQGATYDAGGGGGGEEWGRGGGGGGGVSSSPLNVASGHHTLSWDQPPHNTPTSNAQRGGGGGRGWLGQGGGGGGCVLMTQATRRKIYLRVLNTPQDTQPFRWLVYFLILSHVCLLLASPWPFSANGEIIQWAILAGFTAEQVWW
jgi:hypothetical protein